MKMLSWFDTTEVDALADQIVRDLVAQVPPASVLASDKKTKGKAQKQYQRIFGAAHKLALERSLNVYKRARFANRTKWGLREAGYPQEFVDEMAYELAVVVSTAK